MIVELSSAVALAAAGYILVWYMRRRDHTGRALRELVRQVEKNKEKQ